MPFILILWIPVVPLLILPVAVHLPNVLSGLICPLLSFHCVGFNLLWHSLAVFDPSIISDQFSAALCVNDTHTYCHSTHILPLDFFVTGFMSKLSSLCNPLFAGFFLELRLLCRKKLFPNRSKLHVISLLRFCPQRWSSRGRTDLSLHL